MFIHSLMTRGPSRTGLSVEPEGVSDIETGGGEAAPTVEELQAQLKAAQDRHAEWQKKEELYLQALAEKSGRGAPKPQPQEPAEDEEPLDPVVARHITKLQRQHEASLNAVQDQFDEMSFLQYAASAGLDPQTVAETSKLYADYRSQGVRVRGADGQERAMTRADVLYQVIGRREVQNAFKAAPEKNLNALKSKLIGPAGFEGVGAAPEGQRYVRIDSEVDKLPVKDRVGKLGKALEGIEF